MKPQIKLATAKTPDGGVMELFQHDRDFVIRINGQELMNSRHHESEQELARLGCANLAGRRDARVLIGGLGMGYTLRQTLDMLAPTAHVVVSELLTAVVDWNRAYFRDLNAAPLDDKRTTLIPGDIFPLLLQSSHEFDAILLDIDNGPRAITDAGNQRLYSPAGILACRRALRKQGSLAVWSSEPSKEFEQLLIHCGFTVRRYRAKAYREGNSKPLFIFVAAHDQASLPPGGGEPRLQGRKVPKESRSNTRE
jgi:spermidine synthase